jgi:hypothetical protein
MNMHTEFVASRVSGVRGELPNGTDVPDYKQSTETPAS